MENRNFDFFEIMETNFSEDEVASLPEFPQTRQPEPEKEADEEEQALRIYRASLDPSISDYLASDDMSTEELVNRLLISTDLTESEARRLAGDVSYDAREIVGYDDEA